MSPFLLPQTQTHTVSNASYTTTLDYAINSQTHQATRTIHYPPSPDGLEVVETYDDRFRMSGVSGGTGIGAAWTFDLANRRTGATMGNAVTSGFAYDVDDRLGSIGHMKDGSLLLSAVYGYDVVGNRAFTLYSNESNHSEVYTHDARDRLRAFGRGVTNLDHTAIQTPLMDPVLPSAQTWTSLDKRDNWLDSSLTINGNTTQQTRTVNDANEYLTLDPDGSGPQTAVDLTHDANGNLTQDPTARSAGDGSTPSGQKYEYDEENRLTRIRRASDNEPLLEIAYDALWRRVETRQYLDAAGDLQNPPTVTRHIALGAATIQEYLVTTDERNAEVTYPGNEFVWGRRFPEPVAMINYADARGIGWLHYLRDVLGNVVALTDDGGNVVERYRYDPYGRTYIYDADGTTLRPASRYANPFAFTGQRYDAATGTYHFLFRSYSPTLGRWLQRDPSGYVDGVSLYEYVASSPLSWFDPFGLQCPSGMADVATGAAAAGAEAATAGSVIDGLVSAGNAILDVVAEGVGILATAGSAVLTTWAFPATMGSDDIIDPTVYSRSADDLPANGKPNSTDAVDRGNGEGTIRDYGPDGKAETDYDFGHDYEGEGDPHAHDWDWSQPMPRGRARPIRPGE